MAAAKGFWGLKGPGRGRPAAALLLGRPGPFFEAILQASHFVEYYDEEMDFEPYRLGVRTAARPSPALERELLRLPDAFPLLLGFRTLPPRLDGGGRIYLSPGGTATGAGAGDLVIGLRGGVKAGRPGQASPEVVTAREASAAGGTPRLPAVRGAFLVIDPLVMDPPLFPVPSNLEPGGLTWHVLTAVLRDLCARGSVRGALVLPCALPRRSPVPAFVLARLVSKVLAYGLAAKRRSVRR